MRQVHVYILASRVAGLLPVVQTVLSVARMKTKNRRGIRKDMQSIDESISKFTRRPIEPCNVIRTSSAGRGPGNAADPMGTLRGGICRMTWRNSRSGIGIARSGPAMLGNASADDRLLATLEGGK
jgi:hypothetical protein